MYIYHLLFLIISRDDTQKQNKTSEKEKEKEKEEEEVVEEEEDGNYYQHNQMLKMNSSTKSYSTDGSNNSQKGYDDKIIPTYSSASLSSYSPFPCDPYESYDWEC